MKVTMILSKRSYSLYYLFYWFIYTGIHCPKRWKQKNRIHSIWYYSKGCWVFLWDCPIAILSWNCLYLLQLLYISWSLSQDDFVSCRWGFNGKLHFFQMDSFTLIFRRLPLILAYQYQIQQSKSLSRSHLLWQSHHRKGWYLRRPISDFWLAKY